MYFIETTANEFAVSSDDGQLLGYVWLNGEDTWAAQLYALRSDIVTGFSDRDIAANALKSGEA